MSISNIVVTLNGEDITDQCGIEANDTGFKIETGKDITSADTLNVTYDVTFNEQIEGDIKNTVTAKGDNTDEASDTNVVTMKKADKPKATTKNNKN